MHSHPGHITVHQPPPARPAFTSIELILALSILAIMMVVALPRYTALRDHLTVEAAANDVETIFATARYHAMTQFERATVIIDTGRHAMTINFSTPHMNDSLVHHRPLGDIYGVRLTSNRPTVTYLPTGATTGASNLSLIVSLRSAADTITISRLGRVRRSS